MRRIAEQKRQLTAGCHASRARRPSAARQAESAALKRRGGYLYLSVLAVATMVSITGFAALVIARNQLRTAQANQAWHQTRLLAQSGVEQAAALINTNPNWQTDYLVGAERSTSLSQSTMGWRLFNTVPGELRLDGIGRGRDATCVLSVIIRPVGAGFLDSALLAASSIAVKASGDVIFATGGPISTNGALQNSGSITADVEAATRSGNMPSGTVTVPGPIRSLPDPNTVFDYYVANGTSIAAGLLPNAGTELELRSLLLSPFSNPFGPTNPQGIYVIDCQGQDLTVRSCRVVGTLVLLNSGEVEVRDAINWEPALANYPALIAHGSLRMRYADAPLSEANLSANFNPPGTPYQGGTDVDTSDTYPSAMAGIFYCTGDLRFDGDVADNIQAIQGLVIAGGACTVEKRAQAHITFDPGYRQFPPPGFQQPPSPAISPGTWRRIESY